jgi:hypothetical protein
LIGFAWDGYPIYGAYGHSDANDAGSAIKRIRTSYRLRNITSRTTLPDGTSATGPTLTETIQSPLQGATPLTAVLGAYEEDFEYVQAFGDLDEYNGRFCKTPEYPNGTYCYFATLDAENKPEYPYILGNYYYGTVAPGPPNQFTSAQITEPVTTYTPATTTVNDVGSDKIEVTVFPNPAKELLVIQAFTSKPYQRKVELLDMQGRLVQNEVIQPGSTMCYFNLQTVYNGTYLVKISSPNGFTTRKIEVTNN